VPIPIVHKTPLLQSRIAIVSLLLAGWSTASAEVIVLKDKASVIGKVLAEKKDLVLVDLGYTVLSIPRSQIVRIAPESVEEARPTKQSRWGEPPAAPDCFARSQ